MDGLKSKPLHWDALTWEEVAVLHARGQDLCLLPVGATEQHGPHLGTGMDTCSALHVCEAVSIQTGIPVLPPLAYGCSIGHSHRWPGTLALQPQTLMNAVVEIYTWLEQAGFVRLLLVNGHVGNAAPLRCAVDLIRTRSDAAMVRLCNLAELSPRVRNEYYADAQDWHANAAETSLMLALAPELVRPGKISTSDDPDRTEDLVFTHPVNRTSLNGVTGYPTRASRAQGETLFQFMVEDLTDLVRRAQIEKPPLDHSYFCTTK